MTQKKMKSAFALGKGLGALIPTASLESTVSNDTLQTDDGKSVGVTAFIDITKIRPNRFQPRLDFDPKALEDLTNSIKVRGVIQPITVRRTESGYELVSGERRVRASIEAGLTKIPAYIMDVDTDAQMLELAIIENVQRENLNPIEVSLGYQRLIEECNLTQEDVAEKIGKDRSTVANFLRLLRLPQQIQDCLRDRKISMGHARAMLAITSNDKQLYVLDTVISKDLSVRKTEQLVKDVELGRVKLASSTTQAKNDNTKPVPSELKATIQDIENRLRHIFSTQVRLKAKSDSVGTIELDYYSLDELERILDLLAEIERSRMGQ
ncbi:MAG: ParB/RepB/Spo0J family partition protein [Ignavibacteria bacterium]|jgi:ParB family chromosome partitioning protein|nr:ParB/RepB/Spo0J family partition protein [Ignavibacteria bacterium]